MMRLATVNDIDSAGPADLRAYAFTTALAMLTGAEAQHELIATLQRALTPHALVTFTFTRVGDRQLADVTLVSLRGGGIALRRVSSSKTAGERWTASELMPLVQRMVTGAGESPRLTMLELIRVEEDYPIDPSLSLFAVSTIAPGSDLMVRGVLTDADRRTFAGRTIAFTCIDPAGARTSVAADTDAMGVARITCPVGTMAGMGSVEASYTRLTGSVYTAPPLRFTVRDPLAALRVGFDRIVAAVNQTIRVIVSGLSPGAEVEVDPSRGSVATSPVTADTAGMASTDFSAPQPGAVEIGTRLASDATQTGRGFVYVGAEAAISILAEPASVVTGGFAELRAVVASSTVPVAGRTVTLVLSGPGTLDATTLTLDAYGEARTRWNAPTAGSGTVTVRASTVIDGETFEASADIGYRDAMPAPPVTGNVTAFLQANGPAVCAGPKGDHLCPYSSMSTSSIPAAFALPESLSVAVYQSGPREVAVDVEFAEDYGDIIRLSIEIEALADEEPRVTANPAWSPTPGVIGSHCVHVLTSPPDPVDRPTAWEVSLDYNNDHTHCPGGAGGSGRLLTIEMVVP
ncbi:MAG: hypothetical protein M5U28_19740 [Sandaracinaceae bacterium]|nr:hypothetical protein [Sandaracinaceae bacterium]